MGLMAGVAGIILAILIAVLSRLIAEDLRAWMPRITERVLNSAVSRLPEDQRERFAEEWRGYLADVPGDLPKLTAAIGFCLAAMRMARHLASSTAGQMAPTGDFVEMVSQLERFASRSRSILAKSHELTRLIHHPRLDDLRPVFSARIVDLNKLEAFYRQEAMRFDALARKLTNVVNEDLGLDDIEEVWTELRQSEKDWTEALSTYERLSSAIEIAKATKR